jgi:starch-binding outer membrane protein, SusD/RagB family
MKSLKYITAIAVIAASATSCNKLDEYNPSNATADAVWSTPQGFLTAVNAAYHEMHNWYGREDGLFLSETGTDLWFNSGKGTYARQLTYYDALTPSSGNPNINGWRQIWKGVNQCNAGIGRIDQAGFKSETEKNQRLGELRFLRAFYYWQIVETWGNVMLRTTEAKDVELTAVRSTIPAIYDLIISDLLFAKDALPVSWGAEYSRAAKKSALGLLARVYLTRASYAAGTEATQWYTKARDIAVEVINNKTNLQCDLLPLAELWDPNKNANNKESLFTISYTLTYLNANYAPEANRINGWFQTNYVNFPAMKLDAVVGRTAERRVIPTLRLLDAFTDIDARYEASFQETWTANGTAWTWSDANRGAWKKDAVVNNQTINVGELSTRITKQVVADKATQKAAVLDRNDLYMPNGTINVTFANYNPVLKKFLDPKMPDPARPNGYNDIFVIRLAEMYLIAGEAEWRLNNATAAAAWFNVIRERAAKPGQAAAMRIDPSAITRDWILDERARELCGEFMRWFDLKRMIKDNNGADWASYIKAKNPDITAVQPFHQLRPIPLVELNALTNAAEFGQNSGY